jgi:hypothetical protein
MSQNGPYSGLPWSSGGGSSDEPYTEPADPWGDQAAAVSQPAWGAQPSPIPQQQPPRWDQTPTPPPGPPRRNTPMVALVVALGILIVAGLGTALWMLKDRRDGTPTAGATSSAAAEPAPVPVGSADARFNVKKGDCVVNQGSDLKPEMRATACATGAYVVLARYDGPTTGEKDAEAKCSKVKDYTKWYFYDSPLDDLDFVLCLKPHKAL